MRTSRCSLNETLNLEAVPVAHVINDELCLFIMSISLGMICQVITVFGTVGNFINLVVFIKQGFSESINISLLALTGSDLCALLTIMWSNLCFSPFFRDSSIPMITTDVHLITGSWPHMVFSKITAWITAFISLERCVCVMFPLKVKTIFTTKVHIVVMIIIYTVNLSTHGIVYSIVGLAWLFSSARNHTLLGQVYLTDKSQRKIVQDISYSINGVFMPVSSFAAVVTCTVFLLTQLKHQASWRNINSSGRTHIVNPVQTSQPETRITTRDQKVAKMIVLISGMFIACFIPAVIVFVAAFIEPQLNYDGLYKNLFLVTFSVCVTMDVFNSSINTCIYFTMSTKYRETFLKMFK